MANYALAPLAVVLASVVAGVAAQPPYSDVNELGLDINGAWECPCLTRQHPGVEEVSKLNVGAMSKRTRAGPTGESVRPQVYA